MKPQIYPAFFIAVLLVSLTALLVPIPSNAQSITVISKTKIHRQQVMQDSNNTMVELRTVLPRVVYDIRYATPENFTGQALYKEGSITFLRLPAACALARVMEDLATQDLHPKIFDAYRPYSATKKMWALIRDERYVANPAKGSGHNRGIAIDLTLIDTKGKELDMGTGYDNFTDSAHHSFRQLSPAALANRVLLRTAMERHGFKALDTEWWHYSFGGGGTYDVLDIPFRKLGK